MWMDAHIALSYKLEGQCAPKRVYSYGCALRGKMELLAGKMELGMELATTQPWATTEQRRLLRPLGCVLVPLGCVLVPLGCVPPRNGDAA